MSEAPDKDEFNWVQHLQKLVNNALALDEETLLALQQLGNKTIAFHFVNTSLNLYLTPSEQGLSI